MEALADLLVDPPRLSRGEAVEAAQGAVLDREGDPAPAVVGVDALGEVLDAAGAGPVGVDLGEQLDREAVLDAAGERRRTRGGAMSGRRRWRLMAQAPLATPP